MESLELRIFREVAMEKSISKTAKKMGYVQSNITTHIHNLEIELNTNLFIRHNKGVHLTNEGKQLLTYANQIILLLDNAKKQFEKSEPVIKIGSVQTIADSKLPLWLSLYKKLYPQINFSVSTQVQSDLLNAVSDGILDCAIVNNDFSNTKLTSTFLFHEELTFIACKSLIEEELKNQPIIVSNSLGCPYRTLLENWIIKNTCKKPKIIEYDTLSGLITAVSLGIGISLLPTSVLSSNNNLKTFKINDLDSVDIKLVTLKDYEKPYLKQFINIIKAHFN